MSVLISEDLRSIKTERALFSAMFSVLKRQSFKKITVKGICEDALISRAAFYAHFVDKYDLIKCWLTELWQQKIEGGLDNYQKIESAVNTHISDIIKVLKNLVCDVDNELLGIIFDVILSSKKPIPSKSDEEDCHKRVVLTNLYAGGIIAYISWQIRNEFPCEVPLMNRAIFDMLCDFKYS